MKITDIKCAVIANSPVVAVVIPDDITLFQMGKQREGTLFHISFVRYLETDRWAVSDYQNGTAV